MASKVPIKKEKVPDPDVEILEPPTVEFNWRTAAIEIPADELRVSLFKKCSISITGPESAARQLATKISSQFPGIEIDYLFF